MYGASIIGTESGVTTTDAYLELSTIQFKAWEDACRAAGLGDFCPKVLVEDDPSVHSGSVEMAALLDKYNILLVNLPHNTSASLQVRLFALSRGCHVLALAQPCIMILSRWI